MCRCTEKAVQEMRAIPLLEAVVHGLPDVEVQLDAGDVVGAEVAGETLGVLLQHVGVAAPPVRLRQGLHDTGNISVTTHSTHFMAAPPVRLRQGLHNTGNVSFNHALNTFYLRLCRTMW